MARRTWTNDTVLSAIQDQYRRGRLAKVRNEDRGLYIAAAKRFGTWHKALIAAGITPTRHTWSKEQVVSQIMDRHHQGLSMKGITKKASPLYQAACRHFGSWPEAVAAAGLKSTFRSWNRETVIEAIRDRQRRGLPLKRISKDDPGLYQAGVSRFGNWRAALIAAGLTPRKSWSKQATIVAIHKRQRQGLPLHTTWKHDPSLYSTAKQYFGNWHRALEAAGLPSNPQRKWTKEAILAAIQARLEQGLSVTAIWRDDQRIYDAAVSHFGTWTNALSAVGIERPARRKWTKQEVLEAIHARQRAGLSLKNVFQSDKKLYAATYRRFGSWHNALEAAGIESKPHKKWTKERVLKELHAAHRVTTNVRKLDAALSGAARRYFGSLRQARLVAGLQRRTKKWSREKVIEVIQNRYVQGLPIHQPNWNGDRPLASAATYYFGSWNNALLAAGLEQAIVETAPRPVWTREKVIRAIQERHQRGLTIHGVCQRDRPLFNAANAHFGCWSKALLAAGFQPLPRRSWSPERVLDEIRSRHRRQLPLTSVQLDDGSLVIVARQFFGSWRNAVTAAGLEPGRRASA